MFISVINLFYRSQNVLSVSACVNWGVGGGGTGPSRDPSVLMTPSRVDVGQPGTDVCRVRRTEDQPGTVRVSHTVGEDRTLSHVEDDDDDDDGEHGAL